MLKFRFYRKQQEQQLNLKLSEKIIERIDAELLCKDNWLEWNTEVTSLYAAFTDKEQVFLAKFAVWRDMNEELYPHVENEHGIEDTIKKLALNVKYDLLVGVDVENRTISEKDYVSSNTKLHEVPDPIKIDEIELKHDMDDNATDSWGLPSKTYPRSVCDDEGIFKSLVQNLPMSQITPNGFMGVMHFPAETDFQRKHKNKRRSKDDKVPEEIMQMYEQFENASFTN